MSGSFILVSMKVETFRGKSSDVDVESTCLTICFLVDPHILFS